MAEVVGHPLSKTEVQSWNPNTTKRKRKKISLQTLANHYDKCSEIPVVTLDEEFKNSDFAVLVKKSHQTCNNEP
jgi:hypothetical protein